LNLIALFGVVLGLAFGALSLNIFFYGNYKEDHPERAFIGLVGRFNQFERIW